MATFNNHTGTGSQRDFQLDFPYIERDHVKVKVNTLLTTAFTWFTDGIIRFDVAPALGEPIRIYRETPTEPLVNYAGGAFLSEAALEVANRQAVYLAEEALEISRPLSDAVLDIEDETALSTANAIAAADSAAQALSAATSVSLQRRVIEAFQNTPPGSPVTNAAYVVTASPTGAWVGQVNRIAIWSGIAWTFLVAQDGWEVFDRSTGETWTWLAGAWGIRRAAPSNGDKGDITVSAAGNTWSLDDDAVTLAKLAHVTGAGVIGTPFGSGANTPPALLTGDQLRRFGRGVSRTPSPVLGSLNVEFTDHLGTIIIDAPTTPPGVPATVRLPSGLFVGWSCTFVFTSDVNAGVRLDNGSFPFEPSSGGQPYLSGREDFTVLCVGAGDVYRILRHPPRPQIVTLTSPVNAIDVVVPGISALSGNLPYLGRYQISGIIKSAAAANTPILLQLESDLNVLVTTGYHFQQNVASAAVNTASASAAAAGLYLGYTSNILLNGISTSGFDATVHVGLTDNRGTDLRCYSTASYWHATAGQANLATISSTFPPTGFFDASGVRNLRFVRGDGGAFAAGTRLEIRTIYG
jgi:hypothetical protein